MAKKRDDPRQRPLPGVAAPTSAESIDRDLAASALRKRAKNETPTAREVAALRRFEAAREEELRWKHYASVPKKHYVAMSGRQVRTINEQASRYRLPLDGKTVNLSDVIRGFHDLLAKHSRKLLEEDEDGGGESAALERGREERARILQLERLEKEGQLIPRDALHDGLTQLASMLRRSLEVLRREFGNEACAIVSEGIDEFEAGIPDLLGAAPGHDTQPRK